MRDLHQWHHLLVVGTPVPPTPKSTATMALTDEEKETPGPAHTLRSSCQV